MSDEKHKPWCSERARKENGGCICKASSSLAPATLLGDADFKRIADSVHKALWIECDNLKIPYDVEKVLTLAAREAVMSHSPNVELSRAGANPKT